MVKRVYRNGVFVVAAIVMCLLQACNGNTNNTTGRQAPDVADVKLNLQSFRFDQDLEHVDTNAVAAGLQQLHGKYPVFLNFYLDTIMGFQINGNYADTARGIKLGLRQYLTYKDYRGLFDTVNKHYPDTKDVDAELSKGFQYMKHYYPAYQVPTVMYITTGLANYGAFTYESSMLGIGLDMFLGKSYPYYKSVGIPEYMGSHLSKQYIPVAAFSAIYEDAHPFNRENRTLLDMMIQKGKEQYFLHSVLPDMADSTLYAFSQAQVDWCKANEADVYNFFIRQNMLYDKEITKVLRYVTDGPTSTGMPAQSPGNVGSWLGMQIVTAYMKEHKEITLSQLLEQKIDAQSLLEQSKYKPK